MTTTMVGQLGGKLRLAEVSSADGGEEIYVIPKNVDRDFEL